MCTCALPGGVVGGNISTADKGMTEKPFGAAVCGGGELDMSQRTMLVRQANEYATAQSIAKELVMPGVCVCVCIYIYMYKQLWLSTSMYYSLFATRVFACWPRASFSRMIKKDLKA